MSNERARLRVDDDTEIGSIEPSQFHDIYCGGGAASGSVRLVWAILEDAIECVRKGALGFVHYDRLAREALAWIDRDDFEWPFSFVNICGYLAIDEYAVRAEVDRWMGRVGNPGKSTGIADRSTLAVGGENHGHRRY